MIKNSPKRPAKILRSSDEVLKRNFNAAEFDGATFPSPENLPKKRRSEQFVCADKEDGIKPEIKGEEVSEEHQGPTGRKSQVS